MSFWRLFAVPAYARYWIGDVASDLADQFAQVAILWYLANNGHTAYALGLYVFATEAPVLIGGPFTARLFRWLPVRTVMVIDLAVRTIGYGLLAVIALFTARHTVAWWEFDVVAASNAMVFMATAAGGPNLWPRLVPEGDISHAMQLEQIGWSVGALLAPLCAGIVLTRAGLLAVLTLSFGVFGASALNLATLPLTAPALPAADVARKSAPVFRSVWAKVLGEQVLLLTTALFWVANFVTGFFTVLWPLVVRQFWHGAATLYGTLLTTGSIGGLVGSMTLAGWKDASSLLHRVFAAEFAASLTMFLVLPGVRHPIWSFAALFLSSAVGASTATWVLRLRFDVTTDAERPSVLTYIRTVLHTAAPIGGLWAGLLWQPRSIFPLLTSGVVLLTLSSLTGLLIVRHRRAGMTSE